MRVSVAIVEPVGGHGGMHFYDLALCRSIVKAGGKATLYTCDETAVTGNEGFPVRLAYRGIYGRRRPWIRGLKYLLGSLYALPDARLSGHRVAHFHFFQVGAKEWFNVLLARAVGLRVVITAHDVESLEQGLSTPLFLRAAYRLANRIIAHSRVAQRELVEQLGVAENKLELIAHGNYVDKVPATITRDMAKAHFGLSRDKRVLLFFGQIKDVKGLDVLLRGFALARAKDPSLHLLVGGRVWKTDFAPYAELIERHALGPHCTLHIRYIEDAEVPFFYLSADLVVLPYLRIYQSGVVLEAMSHGSAVLVSDIPGLLEAVDDDNTGFVFRSRDPAHLAQRIAEIFSTPDRSRDIARAGLRSVTERNDWTRLGEQAVACYQRALGQRPFAESV
jgi:D-inositol-3-phosphate glycosyltransferase